MEPIPLRDLTVLLNYMRATTDPRFKGTKLQYTTFADPGLIHTLTPTIREQVLNRKPASITNVNMHVFGPPRVLSTTSPIPRTSEIHPDGDAKVKALTSNQLDAIYHESYDHDGCYKALALYQHFFELCPRGQKLSLQIAGEDPVLVDLMPRNILEFKLKEPKLLSITTVLPRGPTVVTGGEEGSLHAVMGFPRPGSKVVDFVVDMTRMQWGETGRGTHGEKYYMGTIDGFYTAIDKVCSGIEELRIGANFIGPSEHTELMTACAKRVWERWQNREKEGWCDYCGVGGPGLLKCSGCKTKKVWYCGKDHQKAGRKLHRLTCEYKKP